MDNLSLPDDAHAEYARELRLATIRLAKLDRSKLGAQTGAALLAAALIRHWIPGAKTACLIAAAPTGPSELRWVADADGTVVWAADDRKRTQMSGEELLVNGYLVAVGDLQVYGRRAAAASIPQLFTQVEMSRSKTRHTLAI